MEVCMSLGDRLGLAGAILTLFALAATILWPDKRWIGWLSLSLAAGLLITWGWLEVGASLPNFRFRYPTLFLACVFIVGGCLAVSILRLLPVKSPPEQDLAREDQSGVNTPVIQFSYDMMGGFLPVNLPPRSTTWAVMLGSNNSAGLTRVMNDKDASFEWPFKRGKAPLPIPAGVLRISNHDTMRVFNIVTHLTFEFKENAKPGQNAAPTVASNTQDWLIDSIGPGESVPLYCINQSPRAVIITLPKSVSLEVQSQIGTRTVPLIKRQIGVLEQLPITVFPSLYDWSSGTPKIVKPKVTTKRPS
jgi:hypothetical protein